MTLAAALTINNIPIIFSDSLVSRNISADRPKVEIPTLGPVSRIGKRDAGIEGLHQKIEIITPQFAVAFSCDDMRKVRIVAKVLRRETANSEISTEKLSAIFNQYEPFFRGVGIVGFFLTQMGTTWDLQQIGLGRFTQTSDRNFGMVLATGSGTTLLKEVLSKNMLSPTGFETLTRRQASIANVLAICSHMMFDENSTGLSVSKYYTGGTYEIAYFNGSAFQKIEATFVLWKVTSNKSIATIEAPQLVIKTKYVDGALIVNSSRKVKKFPQEGAGSRAFDLHIVGSLTTQTMVASPAGPEVGFTSPITCHYLRSTGGGTATLVEFGSSGFKLNIEVDSYRIVMSQEIERLLGKTFMSTVHKV